MGKLLPDDLVFTLFLGFIVPIIGQMILKNRRLA